MNNVLPLFKSHYSLGRSILTLEKPSKQENHYPISIFDILFQNKLDTLVLVDDNVSGLLQASKISAENKIKLKFGIRIWVTDNIEDKSESSLLKRSRYIIFVKNLEGYNNLIKIWSCAAKEGFYYEPCIDFKNLTKYWDNKNLKLVIPFYDSFLHLNSHESHIHVPELSFVDNLTMLTEDNDLPFDDLILEKVNCWASSNGASVVKAQSIYYKTSKDFLAYLAFRCIDNRSKIEKPELNHMGSDTFSFEHWRKLNGN